MHISSQPTASSNYICEHINCLIKPVLTYGCTVWGSRNIAEIEKCHLQFMKQALKVKLTINSCVDIRKPGDPLSVFPLICA